MGYQFSWETCISSGQYWPQSCQGGPTLGLEGFLRIRGDDGRGWIQDFLFRFFFMYLYPFFVSSAAMVIGSKVLIQEVEKSPKKNTQ